MTQKEYISHVLNTYNTIGSIKGTAKALNISESKLKKLLLSAGAYENETSLRIKELLDMGMDAKQIAEETGFTASTVNMYTPYSKGCYNSPNPTINAQRIRKCRTKKRTDNFR